MATRTLSIKHSGRTQWREVECKAGGEGGGGESAYCYKFCIKVTRKKMVVYSTFTLEVT